MTFVEAKALADKHRNLNGHIINGGNILISKLFIAPTKTGEYDKAMMHLFNHHLVFTLDFEQKMAALDVDVFALYYAKKLQPGEKFNSPKVMPLIEFIETVIPLAELYNNIN